MMLASMALRRPWHFHVKVALLHIHKRMGGDRIDVWSFNFGAASVSVHGGVVGLRNISYH